MINLDEKFHSYLEKGGKTFRIDGVNEPLKGYGYQCDGNDIVGYYVTTTNYKPVSYTHLTLPTIYSV